MIHFLCLGSNNLLENLKSGSNNLLDYRRRAFDTVINLIMKLGAESLQTNTAHSLITQ